MGLHVLQPVGGRNPAILLMALVEVTRQLVSAAVPRAPRVHKPKTKLLTKFKKASPSDAVNNIHGVAASQIWQSLDPRASGQRDVEVLEVGATHALVLNTKTQAKSTVALKRFSGKTLKGYKLIHAGTPGVLLELN